MSVRLRPWLPALPLVVLSVCAVGAPWLAPADPAAPIGPALAGPSAGHPLGTTSIGQDVLSRVMWGGRVSLTVAAVVAVASVSVGTVAGATAGLLDGRLDTTVCRVVDTVVAVPRLPLLVVVAALAGPGPVTVALTLAALTWAPVARVVRGQALALRTAGHVAAARGLGAGRRHLLRVHGVPALVPLVGAEVATVAAGAVLAEAGLAFLGLAAGDTVSWGGDLHRTLTEPGVLLTTAWLWWAVPTGLAVTLTIGSLVAVGARLGTPSSRLGWSS
ncbi:MAG: ABC transporter permease [Dermatophilaceae bacterium]